jgi:hypothetical protein
MKHLKKTRSPFERKQIRKFLKMNAPPSEKHKGREPLDWNGCPLCIKLNAKHYARGLCSVCYRRMKRRGELEGSSIPGTEENEETI